MKNGIKLFLYCHLKNLANKDDHPSVTVPFLTELSDCPAVEHLGVTFQNAALGKLSLFSLQVDGRRYPDNIFRVLSLDAELLIITDASIVQAHQHSAGAKRVSNEIGHSRGGASTKIHAIRCLWLSCLCYAQ